MAPEVRHRLFQALYTTKAKGTGIGLALCRRIVEAHGGSIVLEPSRDRRQLPGDHPRHQHRRETVVSLAGKILIVDDHIDLAENLAEILENAGYETVVADSAEAALDRLERKDIGALITDYRLPGRNGAELIAELRRRGDRIPARGHQRLHRRRHHRPGQPGRSDGGHGQAGGPPPVAAAW